MRFHLEQDTRYYTDKVTGDKLYVRTFQPSEPYGGWPGNKELIREWKVARKESGAYLEISREEILQYEKMLGEWEKVNIVHHPTLGLVSTEDPD